MVSAGTSSPASASAIACWVSGFGYPHLNQGAVSWVTMWLSISSSASSSVTCSHFRISLALARGSEPTSAVRRVLPILYSLPRFLTDTVGMARLTREGYLRH